jgi:hypothetical protein
VLPPQLQNEQDVSLLLNIIVEEKEVKDIQLEKKK